jgi:hypothetical protein
MITDQQAEAAIDYIKNHAAKIGQLRGQKGFLEHAIKIDKAQKFIISTGTGAQREALAQASDEVRQRVEEWKDCVTELSTIETYIEAARLTFETWRTQQANARKAIV